MGCAIVDNQEQQQQLQNVDRRKMDMSAGCPRRVAMLKQPNKQKASQLKESHSALVKILESAPLKKATKPQSHSLPHQRLLSQPQTQPQKPQSPTNHHITPIITKQEPQLRPESGSESMSPPPTASAGDALSAISIRPPNQHYYRKRAKHLTICDTASSSGDEEENPREHSTESETMCPWKKTRIAREWRQKRESTDASESAAEQMICDEDNEDDDVDDGVEADADVNNADEDACCQCHLKDNKKTVGWRRASSESSSGCDDGHQSPTPPPPNTTSYRAHGSECGDSDGGQHGNITELCKKFEENLTEKDVRNSFYNCFTYSKLAIVFLNIKFRS